VLIVGPSVRAIEGVITQLKEAGIKHWVSHKQKQNKIYENKHKCNKFRERSVNR
jgi:hypothetical protein